MTGILKRKYLESYLHPLSLLPFPPLQHSLPAPNLDIGIIQAHQNVHDQIWFVNKQKDTVSIVMAFLLGLNDCLKPENKRLIFVLCPHYKNKISDDAVSPLLQNPKWFLRNLSPL